MIAVHIALGFLTLIASLVLLIWNSIRLSRGWSRRKSFYRILTGLLDLQALIGIITIIMHWQGTRFLVHPILALIAVAFGHIFIKDKKPASTQLFGYIAVFVVLLLTVWAGQVL